MARRGTTQMDRDVGNPYSDVETPCRSSQCVVNCDGDILIKAMMDDNESCGCVQWPYDLRLQHDAHAPRVPALRGPMVPRTGALSYTSPADQWCAGEVEWYDTDDPLQRAG